MKKRWSSVTIGIKNIKILSKEVTDMNNIIKQIEDAQLKENVAVFNVGDTVKS